MENYRVRIDILDYGYIELVDSMGDDLRVVNSARTSYDRSSSGLTDKDVKLIQYMVKNGHWSPFRQVMMTFKVHLPEFLARQLYKHSIGVHYTGGNGYIEKDHAWNELSQRFANMAHQSFYVPSEYRLQADTNKQCSKDETITKFTAESGCLYFDESISEKVQEHVDFSIDLYEAMIASGVAKEQARIVLPLNIYTTIYWTMSLQAVANFIQLRDHPHSQYEIQLYGKALRELAMTVAPVSVKALVGASDSEEVQAS